MPTTVLATGTFREWLGQQTEQIQDQVDAVVKALEVKGVLLGFPLSSEIKGSAKVRELRPAAGASAARAFYAFDQNRAAVLLCGGLKTDPKMYESAIATAERELAGHKAAVDAAKKAAEDAAKKTKRRKK